METIAAGLARAGLRVIRFEFPYMAARREGRRPPPDRAPVLEAAYRDVVEAHRHTRLFIGGKSMGGRIASHIASDAVRGVFCLGYPFHPVGQPDKLRVDTLQTLEVPALVVQGTRDGFGSADEVPRYKLKRHIKVVWLEDGDHSFLPRKASGHTEVQHLATAVKSVVEWIDRLER